MNFNYAVFLKSTNEKVKDFCSMWDAFDYAEKLNEQAGAKAYYIAKVN